MVFNSYCYVVLLLTSFLLPKLHCSPTKRHQGNETLYVTAVAGGSVRLPCYTEMKAEVSWWYQSSLSELAKEVSTVGRLLNGYADRFELNKEPDGPFQLIIPLVQSTDAGVYTCIDNAGFGNRHLVHLHVNVSAAEDDNAGLQHAEVSTVHKVSVTQLKTAAAVTATDVDDFETSDVVKAVAPSVLILLFGFALLLAVYCVRRRNKVQETDIDVEMPFLGPVADGKTFWQDVLKTLKKAKKSTAKVTIAIAESIRDIFLLTKQPRLFNNYVQHLANHIRQTHPDVEVIVGLDSRGFIFGLPVAQKLCVSFVPIRKAGKLLGETYEASYLSRNEESCSIEVQKNACESGQKVIVIDDELATGGSLKAAVELLRQLDVTVLQCITVVEICEYEGRQKFSDAGIPLFSLIKIT